MFNLDLFICLRADITIDLDDDLIKLVKTHNSTNETLLYISKTNAIILSLFDGTKTVEQVINMLSFLFKTTPEKSCKAVFDIFETYSGQLEYSDAPITKIASVNVKDVIKCRAKSPTKYLSPIVRRKIQRLVLFITDACAAKCIYCCIGDSIFNMPYSMNSKLKYMFFFKSNASGSEFSLKRITDRKLIARLVTINMTSFKIKVDQQVLLNIINSIIDRVKVYELILPFDMTGFATLLLNEVQRQI